MALHALASQTERKLDDFENKTNAALVTVGIKYSKGNFHTFS